MLVVHRNFEKELSWQQVAVPNALVFIASDDEANPNWLGPAAPDAIAEQIAHATGPSGANCDYVYRLAEAMREVRMLGLPKRVRE